MLYNYEKDLKSAEERIKSSGISEANKQLIFEFESNCFAEGLRKFFKWLGKSDVVDWMKMLFAIRTDQSLGCPFIILYYA